MEMAWGKSSFFPSFTLFRLVPELGCGEVAETFDLVFDGHGEDFDVSEEEVLRFRWWELRDSGLLPLLCFQVIQSFAESFQILGLCGLCLAGVVKVVEVVYHELHDLGIVVELIVAAFGVVLDVFQLNGAGVSFLWQVNNGFRLTCELGRVQSVTIPRNVPS